jgi:hypothetical protein
MKGEGVLAKTIGDLFALARRQAGIARRAPELSSATFCRPGEVTQPTLFDALPP